MAIELASAYVTIMPSLRGATADIQRQLSGVDVSGVGANIGQSLGSSVASGLSQNLRSIGASISSVGDQLTRNLTVPLGLATGAAAGLVGVLGWKRLTSLDTAQGQLRGLGYSAEDVGRITDQVVVALEGGMMTLGEGANVAAGALAAGVEEGDELQRYIGLVDAAAIKFNGNVDETAGIFNRIQGSGKLMRNELDMIEYRMPGFANSLADSLGVPVDAMYDMVSAGEITSDQFLDVMEDFGGGLAKAHATTFEGMAQNVLAYVGILGENLLGGVFEQSKDAIAEFITFLSSDEVAAWATATGEAIGNAFSNILDWVRNAIDWWNNLDSETQNTLLKTAATLGAIAIAIGPILSVVGGLVTGIGNVVGWFGTLTGAAAAGGGALGGAATSGTTLLSALGRFLGPIGLVVSGFIAMWTASEEFRNGVMAVGEALFGAFQQIAGAVLPVLDQLFTAITPLLAQIGTLVGELLTTIAPVIGQLATMAASLITALMPVVTTIIDLVMPILQGLLDVVSTVFAAIQPIIQGAMTYIQGIIQVVTGLIKGDWEQVWTGIQNIGKGVWDAIVGIISGAISIVLSVVENTLAALQGVWNVIWGAIGNTVTAVWNAIVGFVTGVVNSVVGFLIGAWNSFLGFWNGLWGGFGNAATAAWNALIGFFSGIPDTIMGFFSGIGSWLIDSGRALIQGFIDGISGMIGAVGDAVGGVMDFVSGFFPSSPADHGPLSGSGWTRIRKGGAALADEFGIGIEDGLDADRFDAMGNLVSVASSRRRLGDPSDAVLRGGAAGPLVGNLSFESRGDVRDDVATTMFELRRIARGGLHA